MSDVHRTAARVRGYLDEIAVAYSVVENGSFAVEVGTTAVYIATEARAGRTVVGLLAPVLCEVDARPEQLVELLALNAELGFGKFSWHADERTVTVEYELLGDYLDRDELRVALEAVGNIADTADEQLLPLLGGKLHRSR